VWCHTQAAVLMQKELRPWLEGIDVDLNQVCFGRGSMRGTFFLLLARPARLRRAQVCTQVYQVTNELVHMYRDHRDPISAETCCQMMTVLQRVT